MANKNKPKRERKKPTHKPRGNLVREMEWKRSVGRSTAKPKAAQESEGTP